MTICNVPIAGLMDSGSTHNFIDSKLLDKLELRETMEETLEIVLADGSKILVDKVCHIPIQFCREMKQTVLCHVADTVLSSLILGIQWLIGTSPTIRWLDYEVDLEYGQSIVTLRGQAYKNQLRMVQLWFAKVGIKEIYKGEQAWFMMLRAPDAAHLYGVDSMQGNGTVVHNQSSNLALASKWYPLLTEYADVFEQPGKLVSRPVDHRINLVDTNPMPPKPQLYRMSEEVLKVFKDTIDDYLAHGWIRPSSSSYGTPIIVIRNKTEESCIVIDYRLLNKQTRLDS